MNISDFQETNENRGRRWHQGDLQQWTLLEWAGAMAGEAGEACNSAKKLRRIQSLNCIPATEKLRMQVAKEVADVIIYGMLIFSILEIDAEEIIRQVFNKKSEEYGFPERL